VAASCDFGDQSNGGTISISSVEAFINMQT